MLTTAPHSSRMSLAIAAALRWAPTPGVAPAEAIAALDRLQRIAGFRMTIDLVALPPNLAIATGSVDFGRRSFVSTSHQRLLSPSTPVVTRQGGVRVKTIAEYVVRLVSRPGDVDEEIMITDRPADGRLWHLDGMHRLIAARLLERSLHARVWR